MVNNLYIKAGSVPNKLGRWTFDYTPGTLITSLGVPYKAKILSTQNVSGFPIITIKVNGNPYTFNDVILLGDTLTVEVSEISIVTLNIQEIV